MFTCFLRTASQTPTKTTGTAVGAAARRLSVQGPPRVRPGTTRYCGAAAGDGGGTTRPLTRRWSAAGHLDAGPQSALAGLTRIHGPKLWEDVEEFGFSEESDEYTAAAQQIA